MSYFNNLTSLKNENITIDGASGVGKTVCGTLLAKQINFKILDSGKIYRLFTYYLKKNNINWKNIKNEVKKNIKTFEPKYKDNFFYLNKKKINNKILKDINLEQETTKIIHFKKVRNKINKICRSIVSEKNYIILGRDAGVNIWPETKYKFFFDASNEIKNKRKMNEARNQKIIKNYDDELKKRQKNEELNNILKKSWDSIYLKNEYTTVQETVNRIIKILKQISNTLEQVGIIGEINVGKSSLFNILSNSKNAMTSDIKNTTRDFYEKNISINDKFFTLIDTGGMEKTKENQILKKIWDRNLSFLHKSNLLIWVVDFNSRITKETIEIHKLLKKKKEKTILVINKTEKNISENDIKYWKKIGIKNQIFISVKKRLNIQKLKDQIFKSISSKAFKERKNDLNVLILGQTNVGKSSLFNNLLKSEKSLTNPTEHTTTNTNKDFLIYKNKKILFFDTAGIRKKKLKKDVLEKKAYKQILKLTKTFNIALLILDVTKPFVVQDLKMSGMLKDIGKPFIIIGNKIDKIKDGKRKIAREIKIFFRNLKKVKIILISSLTGEGTKKLLDLLISL